jgi:hypothetical protein
MTNDGSPGYDQGRDKEEEDLDTRGGEKLTASTRVVNAIRQGNCALFEARLG